MDPTIDQQNGQTEKLWNVAVDVSKASLSWYAEADDGRPALGEIDNTNAAITTWLQERLAQARTHGCTRLHIVCEASGGFEKRLLHLARHAGCATALVSGEAVHKLRVVESNDLGKSDEKDPRTILLLVKLRKLLTDRPLHGEWLLLRELGARYDRLERECTRVKNRIHKLLVSLCGQLSFKKDWLFDSDAARAVCALYGFNAAAMLADGWIKFRSKLRRRGVYRKTLKRLWADAQASVLPDAQATWLELIADDLRECFADLAQVQARMARTREKMLSLVDTLRENGETHLQAHPGLISPFMLARILGDEARQRGDGAARSAAEGEPHGCPRRGQCGEQTGPLRDFSCIEKLWRYGGLNLRPYRSGTMQGAERQSRRGRARLRHVLAQAVIKRVVRTELYGPYYHAKRDKGMSGGKAMTAVARKFLKLLFGLEKSGAAFDAKRVFTSERAAA